MQIVSDLQQRPRKGRLKAEKLIIPFFDLCSLVQLVTFLVHTVTTVLGANRTFKNNIFQSNVFELSAPLVYKTSNCSYSTTREIYAFTDVSVTLSNDNANDIFADLAIEMRLGIFIAAVTLFLGAVNRNCVEINFFVFKKRNFYLWKDIFSASELLMLGYVYQIATAATTPRGLLKNYLLGCGVQSRVYLPFVSLANLWLFASVGYFSYAVSLILYLFNTLPKYGIMTADEIAEYKEWLRARRAEIEQSRHFIEQAKLLHARMQMMRAADYPAGPGGDGMPPLPTDAIARRMSVRSNPAMFPPDMVFPTPPSPPLGVGGGYHHQDPYYGLEGLQAMQMNPNLPAPQVFGETHSFRTASIDPSAQFGGGGMAMMPPMHYAGGGGGYVPPQYDASSTNMPRRRVVPAGSDGMSPPAGGGAHGQYI